MPKIHKRTTSFFIINLICLLMPIIYFSFFMVACVPGPLIVTKEDVSDEPNLWHGYKRNGEYILKSDVFLRFREDAATPKKIVLVAPRKKTIELCNLSYMSPFSIDEYSENRDDWPDIKGIITQGTAIKCIKIVKYNTLGYGSSLYIYAKILNGPFKEVEAEISDLSISEKKGDLFLKTPNLNILYHINAY